jgi:hypothetical protein
VVFPDNKRFALSILDDTDDATLSNVKPVYDVLREYGFHTTKTVWPLDCPEGSRIFFAAETLQNAPYRDFVHEVAFHGATMEASRRERTISALEFLKEEFGYYPRLFCNHGHNRENLYWGHKRFQTTVLRQFSRLARREPAQYFAGDVEGSDYFWGDLCKEHITYVRNFTFNRINLLKVDPCMPYRLPQTPYVNYWFSTADAPDIDAFNRLLTPERIDQLEREGGVCIVSTHLGKGFAPDGKLNADTTEILRYLAGKPGWFVPVSDMLDYLLTYRNAAGGLTWKERLQLECRFVTDKLI